MASVFHDHFGNAVEDDKRAKQWARYLERSYARRERLNIPQARTPLARDLGVAPSVVARLSVGRVKGVRQFLYARLRRLFIAEAQAELRRLSHELDIARQCGVEPDGSHMGEIEAALTRARALLEAGF